MLIQDYLGDLNKLQKEKNNLEKQKQELLITPAESAQSPCFDFLLLGEFTALEKQIKEVEAQLNTKKLELESATLISAVNNSDTELRVDRLIVGNGVAGTMLYDELPKSYRSASSNVDDIPNVLVIADPSHDQQWIKHQDALMGQVESLHSPAAFTHYPSEYSAVMRDANIDIETNPYHYTRGIDFDRALRATQVDLGMITLPAQLTEVKKNENLNYPYQVTLNIEGIKKTVYTKHIDLCTGFGQARKLENAPFQHYLLKKSMPAQITPELQSKLMKNDCLIYSADVGHPKLKGEVVVYGGGAMSGAIVADFLSKNPDNAELKSWVSASVKDLIDTKNTNRMNEKLLGSELSTILPFLKIGILETVEEQPDGRLRLTFVTAPSRGEVGPIAEKIDTIPENKTLVVECDQLVVGIGSENKLSPLFKDISFEPYYSSSKQGHSIPIGTRSTDGCIMTWGATGRAGFGLDAKNYTQFTKEQEEYVKTLPSESRGASTILSARHSIREGAQFGRKRKDGTFPAREAEQAKTPHDINNITELDLFHKLVKILNNTSTTAHRQLNLEQAKYLSEMIIKQRAVNPEGFTLDKVLMLANNKAMKKELKKLFYTPTQLKSQKAKQKRVPAVSYLRAERSQLKKKVAEKQMHAEKSITSGTRNPGKV